MYSFSWRFILLLLCDIDHIPGKISIGVDFLLPSFTPLAISPLASGMLFQCFKSSLS